jgi:two-component system sensor histidine kinase/response regulator
LEDSIDLRDDSEPAAESSIDAARSRFLVNTSHEIRQHVNDVLAQAAGILDSDLTIEQRNALTAVQRSSESLLTIVNNLLDVSKLEQGTLELENTTFNLRRTLDRLVRMAQPMAAEKGLQLTYDLQPGIPDHLVGDPGRIRQLLANVVENAIRFTIAGWVRLSVRAEEMAPGRLLLRFTVTDSGIGISPDEQERIFDWFTQGHAALQGEHRGIGLGLPIAAKIATLMGGNLRVESSRGKGSTFVGTIPVKIGSAAPRGDLPQVAATDIPVLVIADTAEERRRLVTTLDESTLAPIAVAHLEPAFAAIRREAERGRPVKAIVLAVGDHPFDIYERLVAGLTARLPVVVVVPSGQRGDGTMCRELGIAGYLAEPVAPGDLNETVLAVIGLAAKGDTTTLVTSHWLREGRSSLKVLVADDSTTNLKLTTRMLENRDHSVTPVENGKLAVEALRHASFDVVLMDLQMPVMDGIEATAAIRADEIGRGSRVPIIAITAYDDRERCLEAGPYRPQELLEVVERVARGPVAEPAG